MKQQEWNGKGEACPSDRGDKMNGWIDWTVKAKSDDPAILASALRRRGYRWKSGWASRHDRHGAVGSPAAPI